MKTDPPGTKTNPDEGAKATFIEAHFDEEWRWEGTYTMRRAVEFVRQYPENYLLPSLRDEGERDKDGKPLSPPTSAFKELIRNLRAQPRLTPGQARQLANAGSGEVKDGKPDLGYLRRLQDIEGVKLSEKLSKPIEITEQLSRDELTKRKKLIADLFREYEKRMEVDG